MEQKSQSNFFLSVTVSHLTVDLPGIDRTAPG